MVAPEPGSCHARRARFPVRAVDYNRGVAGEDGHPYRSPGAARRVPIDPEPALLLAERVARRHLMGARAFRETIVGVDSRSEEMERVLLIVERRAIVRDLEPAARSAGRAIGELPDPASIPDPWAVEPAALAAEHRVLATCPTCSGRTRVACRLCRGLARRLCQLCHGSAVRGQWSNGQVIGCVRCNGTRVERCECVSGKITCPSCRGLARVRGRLAVEQVQLCTVRVHPLDVVSEAFAMLLDPDDFDADQASWPAHLVADTGLVSPPPELPDALSPQLDPVSERLRQARLQRFKADVHTIRYRTLGAEGQLRIVVGREARLSPESDVQPLRRRRRAAASAAIGAAIATGGLLIHLF
jgi:hypothetical protein